ncbi:PQQ-binding-like beta-propeller repeat protein [Mucilaginibacter sp. Mucisp86]|uniref:outer membrane protein assembly factor BamB family protein n=1 Tax=Mucilaginibacter sp. Mucisp86 TaxID=3243060 RepID=UPI0039B627D9
MSYQNMFCRAGILILALLLIVSCKKQKPELSTDKYLIQFRLPISGNPSVLEDIHIGDDTVSINISPGVSLSDITPTISFVGKSISPSTTSSEDFTKPVRYTITAQDGSTKTYVVSVRFFSSTKSITSFVFKAVDNPGILSKDVTATIKNDSIVAMVPPGTDLSKLVPDIAYNSHVMSPVSKQAQDFSGTVNYTLTAEDLSSVTYKVFTGAAGTIYFGDNNGYIYALDAVSARVKWKFQTGGAIAATPTVYKNTLIAGSSDAYVYAIDTARGKLVWKTFLGGGVAEPPCIANDMIYVGGAELYALDARTGKQIWTAGTGSPISITVNGNIAYVAAGTLYYTLVVYNALTGERLPAKSVSNLGLPNPAVANGRVYTQGNESLLQVYTADPVEPLWTYFLPGVLGTPVSSAPTVDNGIVYFCGYGQNFGDFGIYALDAITGTRKWYAPNTYQRAPLVQNGSIWTTNINRDAIFILDAQSGQQKTTFKLPITTNVDPFMAGNILFQPDKGQSLWAFDPHNGATKWQFVATGAVAAAPLFIDGNGNITRPGNSGEQN